MKKITQSQETQQVLGGFFQGTSNNDPGAIVKYLSDDIDFYIAESPYMPWTGKKRGKEEVIPFRHLICAFII